MTILTASLRDSGPVAPTGKDEDFQAYYDARPTHPLVEKQTEVQVVGKRCVYLNDYRIAGGKPYYSEGLPNYRHTTTVRDALAAFSDATLRAALKERRDRKAYFAKWHEARAAIAKAKGSDQ